MTAVGSRVHGLRSYNILVKKFSPVSSTDL